MTGLDLLATIAVVLLLVANCYEVTRRKRAARRALYWRARALAAEDAQRPGPTAAGGRER